MFLRRLNLQEQPSAVAEFCLTIGKPPLAEMRARFRELNAEVASQHVADQSFGFRCHDYGPRNPS